MNLEVISRQLENKKTTLLVRRRRNSGGKMNLSQGKGGVEGGSNQEQEGRAIFKQGGEEQVVERRVKVKRARVRSEGMKGSHWGAGKRKRVLLEGIDAGLNV